MNPDTWTKTGSHSCSTDSVKTRNIFTNIINMFYLLFLVLAMYIYTNMSCYTVQQMSVIRFIARLNSSPRLWEFSRFLSTFLLFPCACVFLVLNSRVDDACTQREKVFGYSLSTNSSRALIGREMSLGRSAELSQKAELVIRWKSPCEVTDAGSSQVFPIHCLLHVRHLLLVRL